MADTRLQRWLSSLEAEFDAAVAREEEAAASDLALSLRQGLSLQESIRRGSWTVDIAGIPRHVGVVGQDFVACGAPYPVLVPLRRAVLAMAATEESPRASTLSLVMALRGLCRAGSMVEIHCGDRRFGGRLLQVGRDHIAVTRRVGSVFVALETVDGVKLLDEGRDLAI